MEDLLEFSVSNHVACKPAIPVRVVGGVIVFSEPKGYSESNFVIQGPWKVAVGVHPKHYHTLTVERLFQLQQLLDHPREAALGECGLDRTIPPTEWCEQEEVFARMLRLAKPHQPLVLHLRGPAGDVYISLADLEGGAQGARPPLFARNLPSNVSKIQNLRPKIQGFFDIFWSGPSFPKFLDPPLYSEG